MNRPEVLYESWIEIARDETDDERVVIHDGGSITSSDEEGLNLTYRIDDLEEGEYVVLVIPVEDYWKAVDHPAGYSFPWERRDNYDREFDELMAICSQKFDVDWYLVNKAVRDALWATRLDITNPAIRWMAAKIARQICLSFDVKQKERDDS